MTAPTLLLLPRDPSPAMLSAAADAADGAEAWRAMVAAWEASLSPALREPERTREAAALDIAVRALETINAIASPNPERTMVDGVRRDLDYLTDAARVGIARIRELVPGAVGER